MKVINVKTISAKVKRLIFNLQKYRPNSQREVKLAVFKNSKTKVVICDVWDRDNASTDHIEFDWEEFQEIHKEALKLFEAGGKYVG